MKLLAPVAVALSLLLSTSASATTVTLGPPVPSSFGADLLCSASSGCSSTTNFQMALSDASVTLAAPADGRITAWRVAGLGVLKLRVLRPASGGQFSGVGTSAAAADLAGGPNATSLPVRANDRIGVDLAGTPDSKLGIDLDLATYGVFYPTALPDDEIPRSPGSSTELRLLVNADVVLAPVVTAIAPASGSSAGGGAVKISGSYLDGASAVMFGSAPASSFTIDSASQITAVAPASPGATVDVRIVGPGGTSAISAADTYTFVSPPSGPTVLLPVLAGGRPVLTAVGQSASRWRKGNLLPKISRNAPPVGTTFGFTLDKAATVRLVFTQLAAGRKVSGKCVTPTRANTKRPKCTRTVTVGTLSFQGHAGTNKIRFQGRLSSRRSLKPGRYTLSITARDSTGLQSAPQSLSFTIVAG
jgi:hypothetical protein